MQNSENKTKQIVSTFWVKKTHLKRTVFTVLKNKPYSPQARLNKEKRELIDNIWSGLGSIGTIEIETSKMHQKPNHI